MIQDIKPPDLADTPLYTYPVAWRLANILKALEGIKEAAQMIQEKEDESYDFQI